MAAQSITTLYLMFFSSASRKIAIDLSVMRNMGRRREEHNDSGNKTFWTFAWHPGYRDLNATRCDGERSALKVAERESHWETGAIRDTGTNFSKPLALLAAHLYWCALRAKQMVLCCPWFPRSKKTRRKQQLTFSRPAVTCLCNKLVLGDYEPVRRTTLENKLAAND